MSDLRSLTWINGFSLSRKLTLNQLESVVFWPYWSNISDATAAYFRTINCIVTYPQCLFPSNNRLEPSRPGLAMVNDEFVAGLGSYWLFQKMKEARQDDSLGN